MKRTDIKCGIDGVRRDVAVLEEKYGMSTETMIALWGQGKLEDTADFARWAILASLLMGRT